MRTPPRALAAAVLAAAAGIHLAIGPSHLREAPLHAVFFVSLGLAQLAGSILVSRGAPLAVSRAIAAVNLGAIALWVVSRTAGLPTDGVQPVGLADAAAVSLEAIVVSSLLARATERGGFQRWAARPARAVPAVILAAGVAFGGVISVSGAGAHQHRATPDTVAAAAVHLHGLDDGRVDPGPPRSAASRGPVRTIATGEMPTAIAAGFGRLWVTDRSLGTLTIIEPATGASRSLEIAKGPSGVATGLGAVWVTDFSNDELIRVDPTTLRVTRSAVASGPSAVTTHASGVWITAIVGGVAQLIDPESMDARATLPVGFGPTGIAADASGIWIANTLDRTVVHVDPEARRVVGDALAVGAGPVGVVPAFGRIWVASSSAGTVEVIDPHTRTSRRVVVDDIARAGEGPIAVTTGGGRVWVANNHDKTLRSIDPATLALGEPLFFDDGLGLGPIAVQVAYVRDALWVTHHEDGTVRMMAARR